MKRARVSWAVALLCLLLVCGMLALARAANPERTPYHGNVRSKIFHRAGCRYYNCGNCVAVFATRQEALQAGYRPCKICKP